MKSDCSNGTKQMAMKPVMFLCNHHNSFVKVLVNASFVTVASRLSKRTAITAGFQSMQALMFLPKI